MTTGLGYRLGSRLWWLGLIPLILVAVVLVLRLGLQLEPGGVIGG